tara:strand:+ start:22021 stop:24063 length:2043 start_codon:yes stop_codon:yes gene_type:complete
MTRYTKSMREALEEVWANDIAIEEGKMKTIATLFDQGKSAEEIAKKMKLPLSTIKTILGETDIKEDTINEFTDAQIARLKKEYMPLKGARISIAKANQLRNIFDKIPDHALPKLFKADIPFISAMSVSRMIQKKIPVPKGVKLSAFENKSWEQVQEKEEIKEFKKMKVTIRDMDNRKKAITDLQKQNLGVSVSGGVIKVDGKGRDLNNFAKDLMNFYGANVVAEESDSAFEVSGQENEGREELKEYKEYLEYMCKNSGQARTIANMFKGKTGGGEVTASGSEVRIDSAKDVENIHKQVMAKYGDDVRVMTAEGLVEGKGTIKGFKTDGEKSNMVSLAKQHGLKVKDVPGGIELSGNMRKILDMQLATRSHLKTEEKEDMNKPTQLKSFKDMQNEKEPKEEKKPKVDVDALKDQIQMLKTKLENEKNKAIKPEPNPETGEVPLQVGLAQKILRDKQEKEKQMKKEGFASDAQRKAAFASGYKEKGKDKKENAPSEADIDRLKKQGLKKEELNKDDEKVIKKVKDMLKGASDKHAAQAKMIDKALKNEADLSKSQIKMVHKKADELPKKSFKDRYGKDGDSVRYATATNIVKKKEKIEMRDHPAKQMYEAIEGLKKKAEKSGMPYGILKKVYDRGMAAWKGGHRPGASQHQWAFARVNSFITKSSGTWGGADKDLAAKVKGK